MGLLPRVCARAISIARFSSSRHDIPILNTNEYCDSANVVMLCGKTDNGTIFVFVSMAARSIAFSNSRTFPGQSQEVNACIASSEKPSIFF